MKKLTANHQFRYLLVPYGLFIFLWLITGLSACSPLDEQINIQATIDTAVAATVEARPVNIQHPGILLERAQNYFQMEQYEEALADYDLLISMTQDADAYYERGLTHVELSRFEAAIEDFTTAIKLSDRYASPYIYLHRGFSYYVLEQDDLALADFTTIIDRSNQLLDFDSSRLKYDAHFFKGLIYLNSNQLTPALEELKAATLDPRNHFSQQTVRYDGRTLQTDELILELEALLND